MKKIFIVAALLAAFSPLTQAQEPGHIGPDMRNDRHEVAPPMHHAHRTVRCRDGSRQFTARACRGHRGVR